MFYTRPSEKISYYLRDFKIILGSAANYGENLLNLKVFFICYKIKRRAGAFPTPKVRLKERSMTFNVTLTFNVLCLCTRSNKMRHQSPLMWITNTMKTHTKVLVIFFVFSRYVLELFLVSLESPFKKDTH